MNETRQFPPPTNVAPPSLLHKVLPWLVLAAFIIGVEYWLGWRNVFSPWLQLSWQQFLVALLLILLSYAIRTWRLYDYFSVRLQGHLLPALRLTLLHNLFNHLLPARTGELSFPMLMRRYFDMNYAQSVSALLWFRFLDLHTILCFVIYPMLAITPLRRLAFPILLIWMLIPPIVYWSRRRLTLRLVGKEGRMNEIAQKMLHGLPDSTFSFLKSWGITWLNWLVKLITLAWVLDQFVDGVSWNLLVTAVVGGELSTALPIHPPAGLGTYEAGIVLPLITLLSAETATRAAINVHAFILGTALLGGLVGWLLPKPKQNG